MLRMFGAVPEKSLQLSYCCDAFHKVGLLDSLLFQFYAMETIVS